MKIILYPDDVLVLLGWHDLKAIIEKNATQRDVDTIIVHPDWESSGAKYDVDLAILLLSEIVEFTNYVQFVFRSRPVNHVGQVTLWKDLEVTFWRKATRYQIIIITCFLFIHFHIYSYKCSALVHTSKDILLKMCLNFGFRLETSLIYPSMLAICSQIYWSFGSVMIPEIWAWNFWEEKNFKEMPKLRCMDENFNDVEMVEKYLLWDLPDLQYLQQNKLKALYRKAFVGNVKLKEIRAHSNKFCIVICSFKKILKH